MTISGAEELKNASPDYYQRLLNGHHSRDVTDIIKTDLPRTFPDNIFYNNTENQQHQLYNVLLAFAHQNKTVGYCQVSIPRKKIRKLSFRSIIFKISLFYSFIYMKYIYSFNFFHQGLNYIAGLLLLVTKSEETAFWLLKILIEKTLPDYYTPTMEGLLTDIDVLSELVR